MSGTNSGEDFFIDMWPVFMGIILFVCLAVLFLRYTEPSNSLVIKVDLASIQQKSQVSEIPNSGNQHEMANENTVVDVQADLGKPLSFAKRKQAEAKLNRTEKDFDPKKDGIIFY